jgi:hypothetical protein
VIDEREEILKAMAAGPLILSRLVRGLDDASVRARPAIGEWAIIEVVAHLADTDERTLARMKLMLADDEPWLEPYDPAELAEERGYLGMDIVIELGRFESLRRAHVELLEGLDDEGWRRIGNHGEHGRITIQQMAAHTAGEDADHLAQIARLIPA